MIKYIKEEDDDWILAQRDLMKSNRNSLNMESQDFNFISYIMCICEYFVFTDDKTILLFQNQQYY